MYRTPSPSIVLPVEQSFNLMATEKFWLVVVSTGWFKREWNCTSTLKVLAGTTSSPFTVSNKQVTRDRRQRSKCEVKRSGGHVVSVAFRVTSCKFPKIMKLYIIYDLWKDAVSVPVCELECGCWLKGNELEWIHKEAVVALCSLLFCSGQVVRKTNNSVE
jgi:hypothetical protein